MEYKKWLEQAKEDLEKAEILFKNSKFDGASFYAQQTAEKSLKAVVLKTKNKLMKIHDLVVLGMQCDISKDLLEKCKLLSQVYSASRYGILDNEIPAKMFFAEKSKEHIQTAEEVLEWAKKKI